MSFYTFEDVETGKETELEFRMAEAPRIGAVVERVGRRFRRLPERYQQANVKYDDVFWNYQVSRGTADAAGADFYNAKGVPGFKSRKSAREWANRRTGKGMDTDFEG